MKRTVLLFFFLFVAQGTMGQSLIAFAPWEFGVGTSFQPDLDAQTALFSTKRVVPVASLLPQVTGDSHLEVFGLAAGARWVDGSYDQFRFRITAAQIALHPKVPYRVRARAVARGWRRSSRRSPS